MRRALALLLLAGCASQAPDRRQPPSAGAPGSAGAAASPAALRVFRVRAYADSDYQARTPQWSQHLAAALSRASAPLEAQFGIRLALESARPWTRSGASAQLEKALDQLAALDPGDGVDWVVGFVAPPEVFSAAADQLGLGRPFGRHFVLRGLSAAGPDAALETAAFLHAWAHTLGAIHDRAGTWMAPTCDPAAAAFSDTSARLVGLGLEFRDVPSSRETWATGYRAAVSGPTATFWDAAERDRAQAVADRFFAQGGAPPPATPLPPQDAGRLEEAAHKEKLGDASGALQILAPLVERYPQSSAVQDLACAALQESGASRAPLLAGCLRAAELPGASAQALLIAAQLQADGPAPADAVPLLARAEAGLPAQPALWLWLAQLHFAAGAVSAAERDLGHAAGQQGVEAVALACARTRRFIGFPAEPLPPEREAAYVAAALRAHGQVDRRDLAGALAAAAQLARDFPGAPAAAVIECRARSRGKNAGAIQAACAAAARSAPAAFLPQYILGLVASARSRWADADAALHRALLLDDSTPEVWASLAAVEQRLRAAAALRDLKAQYRTRFGAALKPALFPAGWAAR